MEVLVLEDDKILSESIDSFLKEKGLLTHSIRSIDQLEDLLQQNRKFETIILDRLIGNVDVKNYLSRVREKWKEAAIVILSTINSPQEKIEVLNLGADDYLGKPFSIAELLARIKAIHRRFKSQSSAYLTIANSVLDLEKRTLSVGPQSEALTNKEFFLLKALCAEPGRVLSRIEILETVWGIRAENETNVLESLLTGLRKKLSHLGSHVSIRNLRNAGYWIED